MNKETEDFLYKAVWLEILLVVLLIMIPNSFNLNKEAYKPHTLTNPQKAAMLDLNILCTSNHNHPLLQGKEICAYIPNLKEQINGNNN